MSDPDPDKLKAAFRHLGDMMTAAHLAGVVAIGLRVGLFAALDGGGAVTSEELAARSGLHERWVREWLYAMAAGGVVEFAVDSGRELFSMTPEVGALLADEASLQYLGATFTALPGRIALVPRLEESFRTGVGLTYDERGAHGAVDIESTFGNWHRLVLVPVALPMLGGVVERLEGGARVADVGCGTGLALIEMAKAFPSSRFDGYDTSRHALDRARDNAERAGVDNVTFHDASVGSLPAEPAFDLVTTFDCLHDMTHPVDVVRAIRGAIKPDGVWFIADIACMPTFEEFVARRRSFAAMTYSVSVYACLPAAMSEIGGAGLGTCGLPEPKMRDLVERGGFGRFRVVPLEHTVNAFYEARP